MRRLGVNMIGLAPETQNTIRKCHEFSLFHFIFSVVGCHAFILGSCMANRIPLTG